MAKRQKRSEKLIANFVNGYAEGWAFAVPEAFRDALDIKLTKRVKNKVERLCWTQGDLFAFDEGDIIYDTLAAYTQWDQAMEKIKRTCQVVRSTPCKLDSNHDLVQGAVFFQLFVPNADRTGLQEVDALHCTQTEFVKYLKTGELCLEKQGTGSE